jgi:hypothetical protein
VAHGPRAGRDAAGVSLATFAGDATWSVIPGPDGGATACDRPYAGLSVTSPRTA